MNKPNFYISKDNENIYVSSDGELNFNDIVVGVFSFCQGIAEENDAPTREVVDLFANILTTMNLPDEEENE